MRSPKDGKTTEDKARLHDATLPLLAAMYSEIQELSKKKPDATLSKGKIQVINRLLTDIKSILSGEVQAKYLDLLVDDELPQHSDVVLMLSQYVAAMTAFREKYYGWNGANNVWFT